MEAATIVANREDSGRPGIGSDSVNCDGIETTTCLT